MRGGDKEPAVGGRGAQRKAEAFSLTWGARLQTRVISFSFFITEARYLTRGYERKSISEGGGDRSPRVATVAATRFLEQGRWTRWFGGRFECSKATGQR